MDFFASKRFDNTDEVLRAALSALAERERWQQLGTSNSMLEGIGDGFFAVDRQWRITYFNAAAEAHFRRSRADLLGRSLWDALPAFLGSEFERRYRAAMDLRQKDEFVAPSAIWPDCWVDVRAFPIEEGLGVSFRDVTCSVRNEAEARRSILRHQALIDATASIVWSVTATGEASGLVPSWGNFTGQSAEEYQGEGWIDAVHPDDRPATLDAWRRAKDAGVPFRVEHRLRRHDGEYRHMVAHAIPLKDPDGRVEEWVGIHRDVTEAKKVEAHQQLLIHELNHRAKNTLATVLAIASQTLRSAESMESGREALTARIMALSKAHDVLTNEHWAGADLADVVSGAIQPYETGGRFTSTGPRLRLAPKAALSFAMAIHELATNAVKHGALSRDEGRVQVSWTVEANDGESRLHLIWQESGGPPVSPPTRRGFGSRLLERGLAGEFDGRAEIDFQPDGVVCRIDAPTSALTGPDC